MVDFFFKPPQMVHLNTATALANITQATATRIRVFTHRPIRFQQSPVHDRQPM